MQSVLRPAKRPAERRGDCRARTAKPKAVRRRSAWSRKFAAVVFAGVGLWLVGGVAWWHVQWWQEGQPPSAQAEEVPAHRTAMEPAAPASRR